MKAAAAELEFETAAKYRDLAESITKIAQQQKITESSSLNDRDVIASAIEGADAVVQVFFVREGKLIGRDHYHFFLEFFSQLYIISIKQRNHAVNLFSIFLFCDITLARSHTLTDMIIQART